MARSSKRPSSFVERERLGSIQAVEDYAARVSACFKHALAWEGLPEDTLFVVFSEENPIVPFYRRAWDEYLEAAAACAAHGYVGLSVRSREVYKRKR